MSKKHVIAAVVVTTVLVGGVSAFVAHTRHQEGLKHQQSCQAIVDDFNAAVDASLENMEFLAIIAPEVANNPFVAMALAGDIISNRTQYLRNKKRLDDTVTKFIVTCTVVRPFPAYTADLRTKISGRLDEYRELEDNYTRKFSPQLNLPDSRSR